MGLFLNTLSPAMLLELNTKQQIFSAMVVYGLLTYDNGQVFIPNMAKIML